MNIWCKKTKTIDLDDREETNHTDSLTKEIKQESENEPKTKNPKENQKNEEKKENQQKNIEKINEGNLTIFNYYISQLSNNDKIEKPNYDLSFKILYKREQKIFSNLLIKIIYKINIFDIKKYSFEIIIDNAFPDTSPTIYCSYLNISPSLSDRRDLLYSILGKNIWTYNKSISNVDIIKNIIDTLIPNFILKIIKNIQKNILLNYGKFYSNTLYDLNDFLYYFNNKRFLINLYNTIEKNSNISDSTKDQYSLYSKNYLIMTESYILLFKKDESHSKETMHKKNYSKLLFYNEIIKCSCKIIKDGNENNNSKVIIAWKFEKENGETISKYFIFSIIGDNDIESTAQNEKFCEDFRKFKYILKRSYRIIVSDIFQPLDNSVITSEDMKKMAYRQQLKEAIELSNYLESLNNKKIENNNNITEIDEIKDELFLLYEKIIEFSTLIKESNICSKYTNKLKYLTNKNEDKGATLTISRNTRRLKVKISHKAIGKKATCYLPKHVNLYKNQLNDSDAKTIEIDKDVDEQKNRLIFKKAHLPSMKIIYKKKYNILKEPSSKALNNK